MKSRFQQAISLGTSCQTAFQIRRQFGPLARSSSVFDHQITPVSALIEYFERDFRGLFERDDLETLSDGSVLNRRFGTQHPHEFHRGIEADYSNARSRHDYLCGKLRRVIDGTSDTLFVVSLSGSEADVSGILATLIRDRNPRLNFAIAAVRTVKQPTRPDSRWQGNDAEWNGALSPFKIQPPHYFKRQAQRLWHHIASVNF